jgi:hypothetical protein
MTIQNESIPPDNKDNHEPIIKTDIRQILTYLGVLIAYFVVAIALWKTGLWLLSIETKDTLVNVNTGVKTSAEGTFYLFGGLGFCGAALYVFYKAFVSIKNEVRKIYYLFKITKRHRNS